MPDSIELRILHYLRDQIDAGGKPAGLNVYVRRTLPLDESLLPAALIYAREETTKQVAQRSLLTRRELGLRIELRVASDEADVDLDPIRQWVVAQVMADHIAGGLTKTIEEQGTQWTTAETKDITVGGAAIDFLVTFYCKTNDLTSGN